MDFDRLKKIAYIYLYAAKDSEAPKSAPFGEYAWPSKREGLSDINEKPTEMETKIFKDLASHFASKKIRLPKDSVKILQKILKNKWYQEVIHEPPYDTFYRGLWFPTLEKFKSFSGLSDDDIENKNYIEYDKNKAFTPIDGYSTSWSIKKSITKDFSTNYGKAKRGYSVTLIAKTKDNENKFLSGPGGLYDVEGISKWHLEKEIVGLEPIFVDRIEYYKIG